MSLRLNLIYIGGTVRELHPFLCSLLKWSTCQFRLIANACQPDECELLRSLCHGDPTLEFIDLQAPRLLTHGDVLNRLQSHAETEHFGFIDSDMFADGDFLPPVIAGLEGHAAVFAGTHLGVDAEIGTLGSGFQTVSGAYQQTAGGLCLGSSHFAVYDNRILTDTMRATGVTLAMYRWEELPVAVRDQFARMDEKRALYDTGKAINLLLQARGHRIRFVTTPHLKHIGTISSHLRLRKGLWPTSRVDRLTARIANARLRIECGVALLAMRRLAGGIGLTECWRMARVHRRKDIIAQYVLDLLESLQLDGRRPPRPFFRNRWLRETVAETAGGIEALWPECEPVAGGTRQAVDEALAVQPCAGGTVGEPPASPGRPPGCDSSGSGKRSTPV